ncbi:hypothetical protein E2C01_082097 [Portunus trituberculatus]|uniref:Uncharacterized protein n=1 Tax=Portunus trituberculatus TaxID=210409 RepID=A0A5B7IRG8_PORTR|nr:hypothetical protein [Portunus trituberculatus]
MYADDFPVGRYSCKENMGVLYVFPERRRLRGRTAQYLHIFKEVAIVKPAKQCKIPIKLSGES